MHSHPRVRTWTHEPLPVEVRRSLARIADLDDVAVVAAMPDVHLANGVCVGAVVATHTCLFAHAVGGDLGCGMSAVRLDAPAELLAEPSMAARVLAMLAARVPTSARRSRDAELPAELDEHELSAPALEKKKATIGRVQFGTLGRGNHFVELQRDADDQLWLMIHSGSRGIGQGISEHHGCASAELRPLLADSPGGRAYLVDLEWALTYARLSRRRIAEEVVAGFSELSAAGARWDTYFDCQHNLVRLEEHAGVRLWVHRKGAISARHGEPGIIPGSMGSPSFHVEGRGNSESLCSSSHGAGRAMSRTEARRKISLRTLSDQMSGVWFDHRVAEQLRDEAPGAYKDISSVMRAQRALTRITRRLDPVLVYKGA